jgi:hypothetical protein
MSWDGIWYGNWFGGWVGDSGDVPPPLTPSEWIIRCRRRRNR